MRSIFRLSLALVLIGSLAAPEVARAADPGCSATWVVDSWAMFAGQGVGVGACSAKSSCPAKHKGKCKITITGSVSAVGVVGLNVSTGGPVLGTCGPVANTCTATGKTTIAPGTRFEFFCYRGNSASANGTLSCKAKIT